MFLSIFFQTKQLPAVRQAARQVRTSLGYQLLIGWCLLAGCCHLTLVFSVFKRITTYPHTNLPGGIKDASIPHPFINTTWCIDTICSLCTSWAYVLLSLFLTAMTCVCLPLSLKCSTQKLFMLSQSRRRTDIVYYHLNHGSIPSSADVATVELYPF